MTALDYPMDHERLLHKTADLVRAGILDMDKIEEHFTSAVHPWVVCTQRKGHHRKHITVCQRCLAGGLAKT